MKNKITMILSVLLSLVITFSVPASEIYISEPDIQEDEFTESIFKTAVANNILETSETYVFDDTITREQYCELIHNLIYACLDSVELPGSYVEFNDTTNQKVIDLAKLEIIFGKSEKVFAPSDNLTREEAAVIIGRTVDSVLSIPRHEMYFVFDDEPDISEWAKNSIQTVCNMGVMKGTGDNKFSPKSALLVRDAITMLVRILNTYKANESHEKSMTISLHMEEKTVSLSEQNDINAIADILNSYSYTNPICKGVVTHTIECEGDVYYLLESCGEIKHDDKQAKITEDDLKIIKSIINKSLSPEESVSSSDVSFTDKMNALMPDDKNYMFSPFSVKMALAMAANGAEGNTQKEILATLGITDLKSYNESAKKMILDYSQSELLKLNVANSIWINKDKTNQNFSDSYKAALSDFFAAQSGEVTKKDASDKINDWVNDKTQGKIPSIINKGNDDFWAMLVNAVYFKGRWQKEFNEGATKKDIFYSRNGTEKDMDFMNKLGWMSYSDVDGTKIVRLPYLTRENIFDENGSFVESKTLQNLDVSMYLMMSDVDFSAEETLNKADFNKSSYIALSVPKFEVEHEAEISKMLKTLGIIKAFGEDAEFQKMFDHGTMSIDRIKHKTYIKVDEKGTEAAAVTAIGMAGSALPPEPIVLKYNKPFTFVIRDDVKDEILFIGEYAFAK